MAESSKVAESSNVAESSSSNDDMTSLNGQKQVNDIMKRVLFDEIDEDGSYFSYLFMEKIFGENRTCQFCGAYGSGRVPSGDNSPELYVIEEGIVGRQIVECVRCKKQETVVSHDHIEDIPTDHQLRIRGLEVRYYCKKITHYEVLHDLLELLHVAAIDDMKKKKEKHVEVASFMMQKAKRVCEEWCKAEYSELRHKKYLRLHKETLIDANYKPVFPPNASEEYKEMYHMMASSFRSNKDKIVRLLELMKESLFDNPTRPSFMLWVSIAMMHSEQYQDFKSQYDPHTYKSMESGVYVALKERFLSLNIPVGIKKIPVVFILFELPRFYHYVDFLTRRMGKRKPLNFLTKSEKEELQRIEKMKKSSSFKSDSIDTYHEDLKGTPTSLSHAHEPTCNAHVPRVVTSEKFRSDLLGNLKHKPKQEKPKLEKPKREKPKLEKPKQEKPKQEIYRDEKHKVVLMIEIEPSDEPGMTSSEIKETIYKLSQMPSQSSEITMSSPAGSSINLSLGGGKVMLNEKPSLSSITIGPNPSMGINTPISIPLPPSYSDPGNCGQPLFTSVETIENVPTEKLLEAAANGLDLEALKREMKLPDTRTLQNIDEAELLRNPSEVLSRIVDSCSGVVCYTQAKDLNEESLKRLAYLKQCKVDMRPSRMVKLDLPPALTVEIFGDERDALCELPLKGPDNEEFSVSPLMFAHDTDNGPMSILPFVYISKRKEHMKRSLEVIGRLFGIPIGEDIPDGVKQLFEKYLKIAIVVAHRTDLFGEIKHLGAIKTVVQKKMCILVRLNLIEMLEEGKYEIEGMTEGMIVHFVIFY